MSQARLGHLYLVHSAKTRQETFFFKASHEPLMGNCKMLCQTSTNGRCLSLAPLKCCHWVGGIKKLKRGRGSKSTKDKQWIQCSGPGCRGALCWLCPLSASAEVLCHWIPCFSYSLLRTDPKRCCLSLGSPAVTDVHLLFPCAGANMGLYLTHFNGSLEHNCP